MLMKTLDLINKRLKQKVFVKDFYSCSTIEELGRVIKEGRNADEEVIDLNRLAILDVVRAHSKTEDWKRINQFPSLLKFWLFLRV